MIIQKHALACCIRCITAEKDKESPSSLLLKVINRDKAFTIVSLREFILFITSIIVY